MDYCLLEDAFKETVVTEKARKDEKRKMKRTKDCFKSLDPSFNPKAVDPDRPAYAKQSSTLSLKDINEAYTDISANKVVISKPTGKLPSYFLGYEDDNVEGFTNEFSKEPEKGFEKTSGKDLTLPNLDDSWKPLTPNNKKENTSYFDSLPTPGGTYPIWNKLQYEPRDFNEKTEEQQQKQQQPTNNNNSELQVKIDLLLKRLDDLEKESKRSPSENQTEIIAFVATGAFLIFTLSLLR